VVATIRETAMRARATTWLAWSVWTVTVMLVALGLLLFWAAIGRVHDPFSPYLSNLCVSALSLSTVGALIASRRKGNPIGWLFCASGLLFGVQVFAGEYGLLCALHRPRALCRRATFRGGWPLGFG
jgi:cytochrome bd-type quinol oxidase subunit 2